METDQNNIEQDTNKKRAHTVSSNKSSVLDKGTTFLFIMYKEELKAGFDNLFKVGSNMRAKNCPMRLCRGSHNGTCDTQNGRVEEEKTRMVCATNMAKAAKLGNAIDDQFGRVRS